MLRGKKENLKENLLVMNGDKSGGLDNFIMYWRLVLVGVAVVGGRDHCLQPPVVMSSSPVSQALLLLDAATPPFTSPDHLHVSVFLLLLPFLFLSYAIPPWLPGL